VSKTIFFITVLVLLTFTACSGLAQAAPSLPPTITLPTATPTPLPGMPTQTVPPVIAPYHPQPATTATATPIAGWKVPEFQHIVMIVFENKEYTTIIGNSQLPYYNQLAKDYTLLNQHYAIRHPSLPNYIALIGGDTFNIDTDTPHTYITAPSLPDFIEASGRTWKTYQESMPQACGLKDTLRYVQKHNPFVFFTSVRNNPERCADHVLPLTGLDGDMKQGALPNYVFIMPNLCNSAHDSYDVSQNCGLGVMDNWLKTQMNKLLAYPSFLDNSLVIVTWDEGQGDHTCCGLKTGGGRIPTLLISNKTKKGFQDETPYTHYSILKTISEAWVLPALLHAADPETNLITAPWVR
jgi:phosphatidylinositol-3-phosphatase